MNMIFLFLLFSFSAFANKNPSVDRYIEPKILKQIPVFPMQKIDTFKTRATKEDLQLINKYYRHPSLVDKVQGNKYLFVSFIYTLPTRVASPENGLSPMSGVAFPLTNAIIQNFKQNHSSNVVLNKRPFGFSIAFGSQVAYSIKREFEFVFYQASYIYNNNNPNAVVNDPNANRLKIIYPENGFDVTVLFDNAEYIRRTIGLHYNIQKDFNSFFSSNPDTFFNKITPFIAGGIGLTSRVTMLRLSNGILGNGGGIEDVVTNVNYLKIMPSFNLGAGFRYKISDKFAFNLKFNTIQVINDINLSNNYVMQGGFVVFF